MVRQSEQNSLSFTSSHAPNVNATTSTLSSSALGRGQQQQVAFKNIPSAAAASASIKHEKEMIEKQLNLIERRRLELMHSRKSLGSNINNGSANLNSITNQQWDILNEYSGVTTTTLTSSSSSTVSNVNNKKSGQLSKQQLKINKKKSTTTAISSASTNKMNKNSKYIDQSNILHLELLSSSESQLEGGEDADADEDDDESEMGHDANHHQQNGKITKIFYVKWFD